jgi:hypothetical protein
MPNIEESERVKAAIDRGGRAISTSQDNNITKWVEAETSDDVVPRDHYSRCAVHFITEDAREELSRTLRQASFNFEQCRIKNDNLEVAGSGAIIENTSPIK